VAGRNRDCDRVVHGSQGDLCRVPRRRTCSRRRQVESRKGLQAAGACQSEPVFRHDKPWLLTTTRYQQYDASLRVRVKDQSELSRRRSSAPLHAQARRAMSSPALLGPRQGRDSSLKLRVPIQRVQGRDRAFSAYGRACQPADRPRGPAEEVDALGIRIRSVRARSPAASPSAARPRQGAFSAGSRGAARRPSSRAQLASIRPDIAVAAKQKHAAAPPAASIGTLDDAGSVLLRELELLLLCAPSGGPAPSPRLRWNPREPLATAPSRPEAARARLAS
jgi:hypothetical protein